MSDESRLKASGIAGGLKKEKSGVARGSATVQTIPDVSPSQTTKTVFGKSENTTAQLYNVMILALSFIDNVNPIAWGKVATWHYTLARKSPNWAAHVYLRVMFLITNILNVLIQYSGLLFTPLESVTGPLPHTGHVRDAILLVEGLKYSGLTNHILQTLLLYSPTSDFSKNLVNSSRHYMDEIQFMASIWAATLIFLAKGGRAERAAYAIYALFLWTDFILKRQPRVRSIPRRKIGALAHEAQNIMYSVNPKPGEIAPPPTSSGFAFRAKQTSHVVLFYGLFFTTNAALQIYVYTPFFSCLITEIARCI